MRARIVRRLVQATITDELDAVAVRQEVAALYARSRGFDETISINASDTYAGVADPTFAEAGRAELRSPGRGLPRRRGGGSRCAAHRRGLLDPDIGYTGLRGRTAERLSAEASRLQDDATARQQLFGGIAVGGLVLALLVTWLASRSITRPLRSLKEQAEEMAGTRLPSAVRQILDTPPGEDVVIPEVEPITVKTRDEVAEVAAALSNVQSSAVDLAVEQAVLRRNISDSYINLGRRNQNLLSRQLDFITELERNETDPDTLEGLFRLDHLATRMRRNAESLLVLAGIEPPRQWSAPVKVADVVRAALGEVEDYQRVVVRHLEPAAVTGAVAADVAHVLAELIENALSFSPPDQSVEVKGRLTPAGLHGRHHRQRPRHGARRTSSGPTAAWPARRASRSRPPATSGHYVAGHLASRLGVVVELQDSPAGGITARIDVPMGLLADDEHQPRPGPAAAPRPLPDPAPVEAGPTTATVSAETTVSGLPATGERQTAMAAAARDGRRRPQPVPPPASVPTVPGFGGLVATPPGPSAVHGGGQPPPRRRRRQRERALRERTHRRPAR